MTLALIAGQGGLPPRLARALDGTSWRALHLKGFPPEAFASEGFRVEHLGSVIAGLRNDGVTKVCLAGRIARPRLDPAAVDATTMPLVPRMMAALRAGDDAALRTVVAFFEEAGVEVVSAQDLDPTLLDLPLIGTPLDRDRADIFRARDVHTALGALDIGQAVVVAGGQVLAVEALPGTDRMLAALAEPFPRPEGGVLFKAAKPDQDRRIDMATIGPDTVRHAAAAGLAGIAVPHGEVLVLEPETLRDRLVETGLFLEAV
ncbi:hypothetical protein JSE7799_03770 [Jannaschia seosinensis]|uniref:Phosphatidate cytidylyltransferase n=1 Tax=Jannaschia seosinensis TaxID=313367 RepID=A0A0M7BG17_9RHOB|nr:UDP-2,3-diacylglucosamine diphosphatase LpxI [Jannaschia seosinensis]CUH41028.1 hypothetical protein JSE7799_03770 [Jannaschia seosinensis]